MNTNAIYFMNEYFPWIQGPGIKMFVKMGFHVQETVNMERILVNSSPVGL